MKLIDTLYKPNVVFIPIGDVFCMGPRTAAYAIKNFLHKPDTIIPMFFSTLNELTGTVEEFEEELKEHHVRGKHVIHPKQYLFGKPIKEFHNQDD